MKKLLLLLFFICISSYTYADDHGIIKKASPHSVEETISRFEVAVKIKGLKSFPQIDHTAAANEYDAQLRPTVVLSFGNPRYGTPIMDQNPIAGIDFPPKAIVYEDNEGKVWIAYNSSKYFYETIFKRHDLEYKDADVEFFQKVLEELTDYAIAPKS